jgi:hypothetical protein
MPGQTQRKSVEFNRANIVPNTIGWKPMPRQFPIAALALCSRVMIENAGTGGLLMRSFNGQPQAIVYSVGRSPAAGR